MRDPYWEYLHAAIAVETRAKSQRVADRSREDLGPGDIAICVGETRLRYVFYEFLRSRGHVLWGMEKRLIAATIHDSQPRPCVILERSVTGSFIVCLLATVGLNELTEATPSIRFLSIPFGNDQRDGLRLSPPLPSRFLFAAPIERSELDLIPLRWVGDSGYVAIRPQLDYGELERARQLVRAKTEVHRMENQA
jgi:hypothetical protein